MGTTHTTRVVVAVCAVIAIGAFIGGYYFRGDSSGEEVAEQSSSPTPSVTVSPTPTASAVYKPSSYTVRLTSGSLSPKALSIRVGDTVTLLNASNAAFWPASDPHPTHTACPGFDALRGLANGESYTLTFTRAQTCGYYNHLDSANTKMRGTITVR